ncbi:protein of unknown function [Pseudomonas sp. JV551A1]|uniref:Uncharacterized protein n=1 Tax=Pseudomonas inefficax TaxID=2078786 RepID=A0AAQ1SU32_9PSED|nr:protein of unknown function [Pseudomonas sp. JV551A1]SPO61665.1 protein of unknown function [Pseudomonas inefficax]
MSEIAIRNRSCTAREWGQDWGILRFFQAKNAALEPSPNVFWRP